MKQFFRTVVGKTVLVIFCVLLSGVLAGSVLGAVMLADGMDVYTMTEEQFTKSVQQGDLVGDVVDLVYCAARGQSVYADNGELLALVENENSEVRYRSADLPESFTPQFRFKYVAEINGAGELRGVFRMDDADRYYGWDSGDRYYESDSDDTIGHTEVYTVWLTVKEGTSRAARQELLMKVSRIGWSLRYAVYGIILLAALLLTFCFVGLMTVSGRKPGSEELYPGPLNRVPFDLLLAAYLAMGVLAVMYLDWLGESLGTVLLAIAICIAALAAFFGLCMSAAIRVKQHALLKNSVIGRLFRLVVGIMKWIWKQICRICRLVRETALVIPTVWKAVLIALALIIVEFVALCTAYEDALTLLFWAEKLLLFIGMLYLASCVKRLEAGGKALAEGDLHYVTDTSGMPSSMRQHGEHLNSAALGIAAAVEERIKSERMKTELITNVSHDLKTPLTSVINYATLIGGEECDNPKITEYAEVLVRQSERLKRLIEDLVEVSKASTGNLEVGLMPCDAQVFLTQVEGEYEEKLTRANLGLVVKQPEQELPILADGRRMWRIFDNLMNNICKYAAAGTRVYLTLEEKDGSAVITFKNVSRAPLDLTEEEFLERFTRGDASRNTEGNGLGLSIAKSMAELQGGNLRLSIDGDLFKAILSFPLINREGKK